MNAKEIRSAFSQLPAEERSSLLAELVEMNQVHSDYQLTRKKVLDNKQGCCPYCKNNQYRKHGKDKGSQRYKCKSCGRTFTEYTGTWMSGLHKKKLTGEYIKLMEQELSLDKIKGRLGINKKTAFDWRHKILSGLGQDGKKKFKGITESDETFFRFSEKGRRDLNRKPHKRGSPSGRGINKNQVAVIVTADRANQTDLTVARRGRIKKVDIERAIGGLTTSETILCSDSHVSYKGYAIDNKIEHHPLRSDMKQRVIKGLYHIQHVNAIDSRLKRWLSGRFGGVSTKYLQKYLNWFRAKEILKDYTDYPKEFAQRALADISAIHTYRNTEKAFQQICILQR